MSRLPIRIRLTAAFALAMAVLLTVSGLVIYLRLASSLDRTLDAGLRSRADDVAALVRQSSRGLAETPEATLVEADESFAQVVRADGRIVDSSPQLQRRAVLSRPELARARRAPLFLDGRLVPGSDERVRLLAAPVTARGERLVIVVGSSREPRDEALSSLRTQLVLGIPVALLLASLLGYVLTGSALRPVESMRRRAEEIGEGASGQRLPVPPSRDEIGLLGETLNAMLARLEEALERERRFVADASHELRTPLGLLKAELELALRRPRSPEDLEAALRSAAEETDRLSRLAEDLLVLARADHGRLPLRVEELDVRELLARVAARFGRRGEDVEIAAPPGLTVPGDRLRLEQAVGNLLDNAFRHGRGQVGAFAGREGGEVVVHVLDEGDGVPAAVLERLGERFARGDEARSAGGVGLGFAIVAAIARAHGGSAALTNRPGGGADARLALPAHSDRP